MNDIRATSWLQVQDLLFDNKDYLNPTLSRYRSPFAYRGMPKAFDTLETSLMQLGGDYWRLEWNLLRNFRKYAHQGMINRDTDWHWLALAQHHGLPTRLLDWTFSPYVALHFVTAEEKYHDCDGLIWAVNFESAHRFLPPPFIDLLKRENANDFTVEMLSTLAIDPLQLHEITPDEYVIFFEPPSIDERIINQYALFSIHSHSQGRQDTWFRAHPGLWKRIIIPHQLKWEIRDKLDQANITERVLFPGLDGLAKWLRRHYSFRPTMDQPPQFPH